MKIKIPEGEFCEECYFYGNYDFDDICNLFGQHLKEKLHNIFKCDQCKNSEEITIEYE